MKKKKTAVASGRRRKQVKVEFYLDADYVERLRAVVREEGVPEIDQLGNWCKRYVEDYCQDKRRTAVALKRLGISWLLPFYQAMVEHTGSGGVPGFVREAVYEDLCQQTEREITPLPPIRESRRANAKKKYKAQEKYKEQGHGHDKDHSHPIALPVDWCEAIEELYPGEVSTYVMACAQEKLQQETGKLYPAKRTMKPYLSEFADVG
jgi:hypothetical protein